ncbi:MAG TPA: hypothetical protein VM452_20270, partial [Caulifigura sp.]|nr:hypothetical protein [Caulifigura sp.]
IVHAQTTPYQRIVVTQSPNGFQLWLNGHLQFNSIDEYRYHEALVHPAFAVRPEAKRVLILGGGDGLALREVLKYPQVEAVTLVDLDPAMTSLHEHFPPLKSLAADSYADPRVTVINDDAYVWVGQNKDQFDLVLIDFPDPNSFSVGKLYTSRFYRLLRARVADEAIVSIQCTSPLIAPQSYWCILKTMETAGFRVWPYQATVPSFGVWGFALASPGDVAMPQHVPEAVAGKTRFLNDDGMKSLFELPADLQPRDVEINRLDSQALVRYYETEWRQWN